MEFFEEHGGGVIVQGLHPGSKISSSGLKHAFSKKARIVLPSSSLPLLVSEGHVPVSGAQPARVHLHPETHIRCRTRGFATGPQARAYGRGCIVLLSYTSVAALLVHERVIP